MENAGNALSSRYGRQNYNNANTAGDWDIWDSRFDWTTSTCLTLADAAAGETNGSTYAGTSALHGLSCHRQQQQNYSVYAGEGSHLHPDPHLVCLNLGKRNYFEDATAIDLPSSGKRRVQLVSGNRDGEGSTAVSSCQVEGCHVVLLNAKEYHKRHKVCEMHSKAPNVVVQGREQRFCQQCSRFHVLTEFDESKRSCRRRLAGHNERRRKTPNDSLVGNTSRVDKFVSSIGGRYSFIMSQQAACSLLSSSKSHHQLNSWDLSTRSSAALRELIAENRAAMFARQLIFNQDSYLTLTDQNQDMSQSLLQQPPHPDHQKCQLLPAEPYRHVTLDLMQASSSAFGIFSSKAKQEGGGGGGGDDCEERATTNEFENFQYFSY